MLYNVPTYPLKETQLPKLYMKLGLTYLGNRLIMSHNGFTIFNKMAAKSILVVVAILTITFIKSSDENMAIKWEIS